MDLVQVHMLNDDTRGATMEAVVSRMKTVESALTRSARENLFEYAGIRFMAISATVPNVKDVRFENKIHTCACKRHSCLQEI